MHLLNQYPPGIQPPLSPPPQYLPYQQSFNLLHQGSSPLIQQKNIHMKPSTSAPTIGTKKQQQQQPHHKSWPDVFFGGRDLFDTLPYRKASASTQYAFELYPNSTATSLTSSPSIQQQGYYQNKPLPMMNSKYI